MVRQSSKPAADAQTISVAQEEIEVGRRVVETGHALRVRKHVDEELVDIDQPLVHEFAEAERVPVGRVLDQPAEMRQEGDVTIVPVMEERLVVRRELVLVEEVRITRRRETRPSGEKVKLRRERVVIERFDPDTGEWRADPSAAADPGPDS